MDIIYSWSCCVAGVESVIFTIVNELQLPEGAPGRRRQQGCGVQEHVWRVWGCTVLLQRAVLFKSACPRAYSYSYDEGTRTFTCASADYVINFCPPQGNQSIIHDQFYEIINILDRFNAMYHLHWIKLSASFSYSIRAAGDYPAAATLTDARWWCTAGLHGWMEVPLQLLLTWLRTSFRLTFF